MEVNRIRRLRPTPALAVAMLALVLAMSGAAVALDGRNSVGAKDIRKNAVRSQEVKGKSLKGRDLRDDAISSKQVAPDSLRASDLAGFEIADDSPTRLLASESAGGIEPARAAAPEVILYEEGELTLYAKCYRDSGAGVIEGSIFARAGAGAQLDGAADLPDGDAALLGPETAEGARRIATVSTAAPGSADFETSTGAAVAADGVAVQAIASIGVKQGNLAGGNGTFGEGNVCQFSLTLFG